VDRRVVRLALASIYRRLWKSDGTTAGTSLVADIVPGEGWGAPTGLTSFDGRLYFAASDAHGRELWKSDGTATGTEIAFDDNRRLGSIYGLIWQCESQPVLLTVAGGRLYFVNDSIPCGGTFWSTDGSQTGTVLVADFDPDGLIPQEQKVGSIGEADDILYFSMDHLEYGSELWRVGSAVLFDKYVYLPLVHR
jgi:ELWxxDGT repeat protein